ncbi:MAG: helix-turn-helix transcriptional regulator [Vulcanimicrobiota bacterium]
MQTGKFVYTAGAIRDFREIYAAENLSRAQALCELRKSVKGASLERTQADGAQVLRSLGERKHYLLVGKGRDQNRPVLAVASTSNLDPDGWWVAPVGDNKLDLPDRLVKPESASSFGPHPGAELRFARETLGISVEELAGLVRMPRSRIEAWERGQIRSWKCLRRLARVVGKLHETRILARASQAWGG